MRSSAIFFVLLSVHTAFGKLDVPTPATQNLLANTAGLRGVQHGERLCALFGVPIATHSNPATTDAFVDAHFDVQANRDAMGVDGLILSDSFTRKITAHGNAFTVYTYDQWLPDDSTQAPLPIYGMTVKAVIHHGPIEALGYVGTRLVRNPETPLPLDVITATQAVEVVQNDERFAGLTNWSAPLKIAYETNDGDLHRTWYFEGSINAEQAFRFFVDTSNSELLEAVDLVHHLDVSGNVSGYVPPDCHPGRADWPDCCPPGLGLCCCRTSDPNYPECAYFCTAADNPSSNDPYRYPQLKPLSGITVEALTLPQGVPVAAVSADSEGNYSFTGLPDETLEIRVRLQNSFVTVLSSPLSGQADLLESEEVNSSQTGLNFVFNPATGFPNWPSTTKTAQVAAFRTIETTRQWLLAIQDDFPGMDEPLECTVNIPLHDGFGASYNAGFAPTITLRWQQNPPVPNGYNNTATSNTVVAHEYGHFIVDRILDTSGDQSFHEGMADAISGFVFDTECIAADYAPPSDAHYWPCIRNLDKNDNDFAGFENCDVANQCEVNLGDPHCQDNHCRGLALAGAFWDLRKLIGDVDAEKLLIKFLLLTDGQLDESILSEVLMADDDDGTLANGTDHCSEILCAFVGSGSACTVGACSIANCTQPGHGWACPTETGGLQVDWNHPTIALPTPGSDYQVYDLVNPPSVVLKSTDPAVTQWDIGRAVNSLPADIGTITSEWSNPQTPRDVSVRVGSAAPGLSCRNVGVIEVEPQADTTYSNIRFGLTGNVSGRARAYGRTTDFSGGRVDGAIAGTAARIVAQDIGSEATNSESLEVGVLRTMALENLGGQSQIIVSELLNSTASGLIINGLLEGDVLAQRSIFTSRIAVKGMGTSTGSLLFNDDLRAEILIEGGMAGDIIADADGDGVGDIVHNEVDGLKRSYVTVLGEFTGNICAANLSAHQSLPHYVRLTFGEGGRVCGTTMLRNKNRYLTFQPFSGTDSVAYRVDKVTSPTGSCWVAAPESVFQTSQCVSSPVYRVWDEPFVHVGDCEIIPVAEYEIRSTSDGSVFSGALSLRTIEEPTINNKQWGDVVGVNNGTEWTVPNQLANVQDVLAILAYVSSAPIKPVFTTVNLQAISAADSCLNCFVNTADVLIGVRAVAGDSYGPPSTTKIVDPANCPVCPTLNCSQTQLLEGGEGGEEGFSAGGEGFFGPESFSSAATFDLTVAPYQIDAEETATVSVYLDAAEVIGGYEVSLDITGGTTGTLTRETITINTNHNNFLFAGHGTYLATNVESNMAGAVEASGTGVVASGEEYLATYTFLASSDAEGVFEVRVSDERSFILDEAGNQVAHDASVVAYVRVGVECTADVHCDDGDGCTANTCVSGACQYPPVTCNDNDGCTTDTCADDECLYTPVVCNDSNACTTDACVNGACAYTPTSSGTACNDGLFCTQTDTCNGSGVCVGSTTSPCVSPNTKCCEATDTCHPKAYQCP